MWELLPHSVKPILKKGVEKYVRTELARIEDEARGDVIEREHKRAKAKESHPCRFLLDNTPLCTDTVTELRNRVVGEFFDETAEVPDDLADRLAQKIAGEVHARDPWRGATLPRAARFTDE